MTSFESAVRGLLPQPEDNPVTLEDFFLTVDTDQPDTDLGELHHLLLTLQERGTVTCGDDGDSWRLA